MESDNCPKSSCPCYPECLQSVTNKDVFLASPEVDMKVTQVPVLMVLKRGLVSVDIRHNMEQPCALFREQIRSIVVCSEG